LDIRRRSKGVYENMRSSYKENNYGRIFKELVLIHKPELMVELGVLDGYSAVHFAKGLKENKKGHLYCYDLWDDYDYKHGDFDSVYNTLKAESVDKYVSLYKGNAFEVYEAYEDNSIDILHVDISNDGEVLRKTMSLWSNKVKGIIAFEGGSKERDEIEWMVKFNKIPIIPELLSNEIIKRQFDMVNFLSFPSLVLFFKKDYRKRLLEI
jgi:hypothetical protein